MAVTLALKALPDSPENLRHQAGRVLRAVDTYARFVQKATAEHYSGVFPLLADVCEALAKTPPDFVTARAAAVRAQDAIRTAVQVFPPEPPTAPRTISPELRAATQRAFEQIDARTFDATRALVLRQLDLVLEQFPPPAAGMEERKTVMIPAGSRNPFKDDAVPPDFVMDPLTIYYTPAVKIPVAEMVAKAPDEYTRLLVPAPHPTALRAHRVVVIQPWEYSWETVDYLRRQSIAVIEWRDGMTIEQFVQEMLGQWEGRAVEKIGRVVRIAYKDGRLGIYL